MPKKPYDEPNSSSPVARRLLLGLYLTKFSHNDYVKWMSEGRIIPDGVNGKVAWLPWSACKSPTWEGSLPSSTVESA
ncbi:unnamed protein product [Musa hybrid cultivar]